MPRSNVRFHPTNMYRLLYPSIHPGIRLFSILLQRYDERQDEMEGFEMITTNTEKEDILKMYETR